MAVYTILDLSEDDYGCEELPEGAEPMAVARLRAEDGTVRWLRVPMGDLKRRGLRPGVRVTVENDRVTEVREHE